MNQKIIGITLLFIGALIDTGGDIIMKSWVESSRKVTFFIGLAVYLIGLIFLALSYRYENIAVASTIFIVFNVTTLATVSWFFFRESLTPLQVGGILLGIASVALLEFGKA